MEIVNKFCCRGIIFSLPGKYDSAANSHYKKKTIMAIYMIKNIVNKGKLEGWQEKFKLLQDIINSIDVWGFFQSDIIATQNFSQSVIYTKKKPLS